MDPFIGEIRLFGFNFAPQGWMACEGQVLGIVQYTALFSLLGTTYGGDGQTTFGLPDLRGRAPISHGHGVSVPSFEWGEDVRLPPVGLVEAKQDQPDSQVWRGMPGFLTMAWCIAVEGIYPTRS